MAVHFGSCSNCRKKLGLGKGLSTQTMTIHGLIYCRSCGRELKRILSRKGDVGAIGRSSVPRGVVVAAPKNTRSGDGQTGLA